MVIQFLIYSTLICLSDSFSRLYPMCFVHWKNCFIFPKASPWVHYSSFSCAPVLNTVVNWTVFLHSCILGEKVLGILISWQCSGMKIASLERWQGTMTHSLFSVLECYPYPKVVKSFHIVFFVLLFFPLFPVEHNRLHKSAVPCMVWTRRRFPEWGTKGEKKQKQRKSLSFVSTNDVIPTY